MRISAFAGVVMISNAAIVSPVLGQSSACVQLQNQLSSLNSTNSVRLPPSARYRQFDRAAKDQRIQIDKTRRMARRAGCRASFFNLRNSSNCGRILESLDRMNDNLAGLEQERQRLAPRGSRYDEDQERSLIRAMNQRGCFNKNNQRQVRNYPRRNRSLIEQIFGVRTFRNDGRRGMFERPDYSMSSRYNTYRTMCVRKMDGYYFPISFSTTPERFEFDEEVCQSRCPGKDVALYFHAMPTQDSEDMVSYREQTPYTDLPAAFAYRKKFDPKATCRYSSGILQTIAGFDEEYQQSSELNSTTPARIGTPAFRSDRSLDPESHANITGLFDENGIIRLLTKPENSEKTQMVALNGRKIRVVGPAFYPVQ